MSGLDSAMPSADSSVARHEVRTATEKVIAVLNEVWPGARLRLATDPTSAVESWDQVRVRSVPPIDTDSGCSVAGAYVWDEVPPVLAVARATSPGRRAFTLLHELAHHLQQTHLELAQALASAGQRGRLVEEAICDSFAAAVLLDAERVDRHIQATGPTVRDVVQLRRDSKASRAAVCVRAAQRLTSPGQILLLEYDGTVQFAASHGLPPVANGSSQADAPVIQEALGSGGGTRRGRTRLLYRDGIRGQELFAQAGDMEGYLLVVTMVDRPPWEDAFVLPSAETGPAARWWVCQNPACSDEFSSFAPVCSTCRTPPCPSCGRCACAPAVKERICTSCFMTYPLTYFAGNSAICKDCS